MAYKIFLYDNEYDCIGTGALSSGYVQWQLAEAGGQDVEVHISSVGGDAFDAVATYNLLKSYNGKVITCIDSVAASAAATIAMAGSKVVMSKYALLMIHKPMTTSGGNADDLTGDVAMLDAIQKNIVSIYMDKTGLAEDRIQELVNATTWLTADEAKELGFVDVINDYAETDPIVKNAGLVMNFANTSAPKKYAQVINKILVKPAPAPKQITMTLEEKEEIVNPIKALLIKVGNHLKLITNKITTNKGEIFFVGNIAAGTAVFSSEAFDKAIDDGDAEAEDSAGNKTVYTFADGKVSNIVVNKKDGDEPDGDEPDGDEEDDDEMDADNKLVMNRLGVNIKKKAGNKVIKNNIAAKLAEVSNRAASQDALIVDLRNKLATATNALQRNNEEIRNEIKSEFAPESSKRSDRGIAVKNQVPDWAKPKDGSVAASAAALAVKKQVV